MKNYSMGIIGLGLVGGAMFDSFLKKDYTINTNLYVYDKFKDGGIGSFENILKSNILFLALPTMYNSVTKQYEKNAIQTTCKKLVENSYKGVVIIKSTVEPGVTEELYRNYKLNLIHNPEFLTARTASEDFHNQTHIVLGKTSGCDENIYQMVINFYKNEYSNAEISQCTSTESESMKIFANTFYSVKIQFLNELYLLCQSMNIDYNRVRDLIVKNGWMSEHHTNIPGPDNQLSYGGLCFPKDTNALLKVMEKSNIPHKVLKAVIEERNEMRKDKNNII